MAFVFEASFPDLFLLGAAHADGLLIPTDSAETGGVVVLPRKSMLGFEMGVPATGLVGL